MGATLTVNRSGESRGGGPTPLFLDQTQPEGPKKFLWRSGLPPFIKGSGYPFTPLILRSGSGTGQTLKNGPVLLSVGQVAFYVHLHKWAKQVSINS